MKNLFILIVFTSVMFASCKAIIYKKFGITPLKEFNQSEVDAFIGSMDLKGISYQRLYFDTAEYHLWYRMPKSEERRKDFYQPIRIMYFDNDTLASFHANCYANPKCLKIDWNIYNRFETFIPKSAVPIEEIKFSIQDFTQYLTEQNKISEMKEKYPVFFVYTTAMKKIAAEAINNVVENAVKFDKVKEMKIYFINIDKPMIYYKAF